VLRALRWALWRGDARHAARILRAHALADGAWSCVVRVVIGRAGEEPQSVMIPRVWMFADDDADVSADDGVLSLDNERAVLLHLARVVRSWLCALTLRDNVHIDETREDVTSRRRRDLARRLRAGELATLRHVRSLCAERWRALFGDDCDQLDGQPLLKFRSID
jgi:hypothetical protein